LITAANGAGLPADGADAGCGVPGGTPEAAGAAAATDRVLPLADAAALGGLGGLLAAGASDAQPPSHSNAAGNAKRTSADGIGARAGRLRVMGGIEVG
jgi:hypothetical protein